MSNALSLLFSQIEIGTVKTECVKFILTVISFLVFIYL